MRSIALTARPVLLILVMVWGFYTAIVAAAEQLSLRWVAPGLVPLAVLVAFEAAVTQRLVMRERQRFEEQAGARLLELLVIILLVRVWSLFAQDQSFATTVEPWIREPLRFFSGRFTEYFVWMVPAWGLATALAGDVLDWAIEEPGLNLDPDSIERQQVQHEWSQAIARYDRKFLTVSMLTIAAVAFSLNTIVPETRRADTTSPTRVGLAAVAVVVAGLLLHSVGRLSQLRRNWSADRIDVAADVGRQWGRAGFITVAVLLVLAPLVGLLVLITPPPPLVPLANALLVFMTIAVSLVVLLLGVLMSPLILLFSLFGQGERVPTITPRFLPPPQLEQPTGERPLLPALIFWGCVILLIGLALARYAASRSDVRDALLRWRIVRWLRQFGEELWTDTRNWATLAAASVRRWRERHRPTRRRTGAEGPLAELRLLYSRLRVAGEQRGVAARQSQTPYEWSRAFEQAVPAGKPDVQGLMDTYVTAEYGPHPASSSDVRKARRHWRQLQRWLGSRRQVRRSGRSSPSKNLPSQH